MSVAPQVSLAQAPPWDRELELLVYYTEPPKPSAVLEAGLPGAEPGAGGDPEPYYPWAGAQRGIHRVGIWGG